MGRLRALGRCLIALAGIFVGGNGTRMGGVAKGLLPTAGGKTIIERWQVILDELGVGIVLVGTHDAYRALGIEVIADQPPGIGPLGGLIALLRRAGATPALALACDMPFVSVALIRRLLTASPNAPVVAPRRAGRWEPLCARYDGPRVLEHAVSLSEGSRHSLQRLLDDVGAMDLPLAQQQFDEMCDWDTPEDIAHNGTT